MRSVTVDSRVVTLCASASTDGRLLVPLPLSSGPGEDEREAERIPPVEVGEEPEGFKNEALLLMGARECGEGRGWKSLETEEERGGWEMLSSERDGVDGPAEPRSLDWGRTSRMKDEGRLLPFSDGARESSPTKGDNAP